jgi:hypothetical protein
MVPKQQRGLLKLVSGLMCGVPQRALPPPDITPTLTLSVQRFQTASGDPVPNAANNNPLIIFPCRRNHFIFPRNQVTRDCPLQKTKRCLPQCCLSSRPPCLTPAKLRSARPSVGKCTHRHPLCICSGRRNNFIVSMCIPDPSPGGASGGAFTSANQAPPQASAPTALGAPTTASGDMTAWTCAPQELGLW